MRFIGVFVLALGLLMVQSNVKQHIIIWRANYTYSIQREGQKLVERSQANGWADFPRPMHIWEITRHGCLE